MNAPIYRPSPWGQLYHSLPYDFVLGGGAAGPGKSLVLLFDPLPQIAIEHERCTNRDHPNYFPMGNSTGWAIHLRRTHDELLETIKRSHIFFPQIDPKVRWLGNEKMWVFSSGYRFQFGHCHNDTDWSRYLGFEFSHIGFDELVTFNEEQFDQISTRLRSSDPILVNMLKLRAMTNPQMQRGAGQTYKVKDPTWVRERYVRDAPGGKVINKKLIRLSDGTERWWREMFLPARLSDNPDAKFRADYEFRLRNAPPHIKRAQLYGDWFVTVGSYYGHVWNPSLHIVEPFKIPKHWPVFRSMDWGFKQFGCVHWFAMDDDDNMVCFYEYTFRGRTDREVAQAIRRIENDILKIPWREGESQLTGPADTQLWERRGQSVASMAEVMASLGVRWVKASKESRIRNAQEVSRRLGDHRSGTVTPGLTFFKGCTRIITTLPSVQAEENDAEMPAKDNDGHWHESLCYACAFASRGKRGIPSRVSDEEYRALQRQQSPVKAVSRGLYGARI